MIASNPFPAFPVRRLNEKLADGLLTIETPPILKSREYVKRYISQWRIKRTDPAYKVTPVIVSVKGDFGSGKTHLLLDAIDQIQQALSDDYPDTMILRFPCVNSTADEWFRSTIGPVLKTQANERNFLQDIVVRLYARAGEQVAEETTLTAAAVGTLQESPYAIHKLIRENLLNPTEVDRHFQSLLQSVCRGVSEEVKRALGGLVWEESSSAATRWLVGEDLRHEDMDRLRVSSSLSTEEEARDVLVAIAAIHSYLDRPFGLMIDELEHLTRYDERVRGKRNLTWLKRLLEEYEQYQTVVYVSGHWEAWEVRLQEGGGDFLSRFSNLAPITMPKLSPDSLLNIVRGFMHGANLENPQQFGREQAEAVLEFTDGNMRRVLTLCGALFQDSDAFRIAVSRQQISQLAAKIRQRVTIEDAPLEVRSFFDKKGLTVEEHTIVTKNIRFDLVAYQDEPKVIVEFQHAVTELAWVQAARRFIEQMEEVYRDYPEIVACFVSDGNVDKEALTTFNSAQDLPLNIHWFDLTEPKFPTVFAETLAPVLTNEPGGEDNSHRPKLGEVLNKQAAIEKREETARSSDDQPLVEQLQREREELQQQLDEVRQQMIGRTISLESKLDALEQRRLAELEEQQTRRGEFARSLGSERDAEIVAPQYLEEELRNKLHTTYSELIKPVGLLTRLRLALHSQALFTVFALVFAGLLASVISMIFMQTRPYYSIASIQFITFVIGLFGLSLAILIVWRRLSSVDAYLEYSARMLREVYIRSPEPEDLIIAHNIMRDVLEEVGPVRAREEARMRLADAMPMYFGRFQHGWYSSP